jgi:pyruvate carboxylase
VRDASIGIDHGAVERADPRDPNQIAAPLAGIVTVRIAEGDAVAEGEPVALLEAMKMESTITAPRSGRVRRVVARTGTRLETGDLILTLGD